MLDTQNQPIQQPVQPDRKIPTLRTFKQDAEDYIKERNLSKVDIAMEQMRAAKSGLAEEPEKKSAMTKVLIVIIFLLVIGLGGSVWYFFKGGEQSPVPSSDARKSILAAEESVRIVTSNQVAFLNSIHQAVNKKTPLSHLVDIRLVEAKGDMERVVGIKEFLTLSGIKIPQQLISALNEKFMLAKFYFSRDWPILLFKIDFYDNAFVGATKWETTMYEDLGDIFSLAKIENKDIAGFFDREVEGRDTRVLKDKNDNVILAYSLFNRKYMVITTEIEPLKEMFRRLSSAQYLNE